MTKWAAVLTSVLVVCVIGGDLSCRTLLNDRYVTFQEPLIEEAVRLVLNRPDGALTMDDLSPLFQMRNLGIMDMSASEQYRMEELIAEYGEPRFQINYI